MRPAQQFSSLIPGPALKRWRQEVGASSDKVEVRVHLGLLRSYEHMGVVQVRRGAAGEGAGRPEVKPGKGAEEG